ncbi:MAG: substrate-binding domain-containing protein, partial [Acidimicrobiaceae bacterium]|nr:substrate-binding domain-containing protein [Acidimicrobiaceae bacterium]
MKIRDAARLVAVILALALVAAACADDDAQDEPAAATTVASGADDEAPVDVEESAGDEEASADDEGAAEPPDEEQAPEPDTEEEAPEPATEEPEAEPSATTEPAGPKRVAYLSASSANTFLLASVGEMERLADENNIELVEFDAQFNADLQTTQLQDAVASGQYDGIILVALNGPGLVPDVEAALDAGHEIVLFNQIVGDDLSTNEPQVDGIAASILAPPVVTGERAGRLTVQACAGLDPCRVVYIFGIRGIPLDVALRQGFDSVVADQPNIEIVAEGEGQYLGPEGGINAIQDI